MGILQDRVAIVTGASSGIGRGCVLKFAEEGAKLVVASRRTALLEELVSEIISKGGTAIAVTCDVAKEEDIDKVVAATIKEYGTVHILANIAQGALGEMKYLLDVEPKNLMEAYVTGPLQSMLFMQKCFPYMKEQKYGRIINCASHSCLDGSPGFTSYEMAKGAIMALTRNAAKDWAQYGIVTNCFLPVIRTDVYDETPQGREVLKWMETAIPLKRMGTPYEDCAPIVAFMASEQARYLNGQMIGIDGGLMLIA